MIEPHSDTRATASSSRADRRVVHQAMAAAWRICGMGTRQAIWQEASAKLQQITGATVLCLEAGRADRLTPMFPETPAPLEGGRSDAIARRLSKAWRADRCPSLLDLDDGRLLAATCTDTRSLRGGLVLIGAGGERLTDDDRSALALIALATGHTLGALAIEATSVPLDRHEAAIEQQRRELSHVLHTGPAQDLAMATMALEHLLSGATLNEVADDARIALAYLGLAGENLRHFIAQLRGDTPDEPARPRKANAAAPFFPGIGQEEAMLAIVREAVRNSRKHAEASTVSVTVQRDQAGVRVHIADDGRGFTGEPPGGHFGLAEIRDIAGAMGWELAIESEPGKGTTIRYDVPEPSADPPALMQDHHPGDSTA